MHGHRPLSGRNAGENRRRRGPVTAALGSGPTVYRRSARAAWAMSARSRSCSSIRLHAFCVAELDIRGVRPSTRWRRRQWRPCDVMLVPAAGLDALPDDTRRRTTDLTNAGDMSPSERERAGPVSWIFQCCTAAPSHRRRSQSTRQDDTEVTTSTQRGTRRRRPS